MMWSWAVQSVCFYRLPVQLGDCCPFIRLFSGSSHPTEVLRLDWAGITTSSGAPCRGRPESSNLHPGAEVDPRLDRGVPEYARGHAFPVQIAGENSYWRSGLVFALAGYGALGDISGERPATPRRFITPIPIPVHGTPESAHPSGGGKAAHDVHGAIRTLTRRARGYVSGYELDPFKKPDEVGSEALAINRSRVGHRCGIAKP